VFGPLVLLAVLLGSFMVVKKAALFTVTVEPTSNFEALLDSSSSTSSAETDTTTDSCACNFDQSIKGADYCYNAETPVMGGLDVVQFFTTFKNADGTYDETQVGQRGSSAYVSVYGGYTYYFLSAENKALFDADPAHYVPQYGGFCAWGMGSEFCPRYGWDVTCMGPHGSYHHWTVQNDKLYFFWFAKARENFLANMDTALPAGDARWQEWFPDGTQPYLNTNCAETVLENADGSPGGHPKGQSADGAAAGTGAATKPAAV
jgi:hypothetical protein